jgi:hypothetical protein
LEDGCSTKNREENKKQFFPQICQTMCFFSWKIHGLHFPVSSGAFNCRMNPAPWPLVLTCSDMFWPLLARSRWFWYVLTLAGGKPAPRSLLHV